MESITKKMFARRTVAFGMTSENFIKNILTYKFSNWFIKRRLVNSGHSRWFTPRRLWKLSLVIVFFASCKTRTEHVSWEDPFFKPKDITLNI